MDDINKCPITGLTKWDIDAYTYKIEPDGEELFIRHGMRLDILLDQEDFIENKHIFAGAILNRQLFEKEPGGPDIFTISLSNYKELLKKIIYPRSPKSKLENLFMSLFKMQEFDGQEVQIFNAIYPPTATEFFYKHFFKSREECVYYIKELYHQGLIGCIFDGAERINYFNITFKGLDYYLTITESGEQSAKCFIAMSFDKEMKETRESIRQVLENNHYEPLLVDEHQIDSSKTINDAIVADIRSCKFCIADFSKQADGVYFESGFALGLGKQVIYTCHKDWFKKSHFDINHFPHIIYASLEELRKLLDTRIKAWVK